MIKTFFYFSLFFLFLGLFSCEKEFDNPPVTYADDGAKISIAQIKSRYRSNSSYRFKNDSNLYCMVTADEVSGNLYKDIYVRDASGAIHVKLKESGGLFIGDSIRINLKGVVLNEFNRLIQLDSVDTDLNIVKLVSGLSPQPVTMTLEQINANTTATNTVQSKLVRIESVEFVESDRNQTLADAVGKASKTLVIKSCSNQTLSIRTSGYANFAAQVSPSGNGSLIGIVSQYGDKNGDMQLILRSYGELKLNGALCSTNTAITYLSKDFDNSSISSGGWITQNVVAFINWSTSSQGGAANPYAKISNFVSNVNTVCETWLISPAMDLNNAIAPLLSFRNAYNYPGDLLEVYVSLNYTSGPPSSAAWTKLNPVLSSGNWTFVSSGNVSLSNYKSGNTRIAFKYKGSASDGSTWEIDDIVVKEN